MFGHLEYGEEVLDAIEEQGTMLGRPKRPVNIFNCGEIPLDCIYDPDLKNPVRSDSRLYIVNSNRENPAFCEARFEAEQSSKRVIPDEIYKRAHFNF